MDPLFSIPCATCALEIEDVLMYLTVKCEVDGASRSTIVLSVISNTHIKAISQFIC